MLKSSQSYTMIQIHVLQYLHYIQRISYMFKRVSDDNRIHKFHLFSVVRQKHSVFFAIGMFGTK